MERLENKTTKAPIRVILLKLIFSVQERKKLKEIVKRSTGKRK